MQTASDGYCRRTIARRGSNGQSIRRLAGGISWEVPFDIDPDWPKGLQDAVTAYRKAWRAKMDEVNACIAANAEQEELVDQPEVVRGVTRVSGPVRRWRRFSRRR